MDENMYVTYFANFSNRKEICRALFRAKRVESSHGNRSCGRFSKVWIKNGAHIGSKICSIKIDLQAKRDVFNLTWVFFILFSYCPPENFHGH